MWFVRVVIVIVRNEKHFRNMTRKCDVSLSFYLFALALCCRLHLVPRKLLSRSWQTAWKKRTAPCRLILCWCADLDFLLEMRQHLECVNVCLHADIKRLGYVRLNIEGKLKVFYIDGWKIEAYTKWDLKQWSWDLAAQNSDRCKTLCFVVWRRIHEVHRFQSQKCRKFSFKWWNLIWSAPW